MWPVPSLANLVNKFLRVLDRPTNTGKPINPMAAYGSACGHVASGWLITLIRQAGCSMREPEYARTRMAKREL
jgi:hypothetical protein